MRVDRPRRWFRFSLRTMFVLVTVGCIALGWLGWNWRIVRERQHCFDGITWSHAADGLRGTARDIPYVWCFPDESPMPFPRNLLGDKRMKAFLIQSDLGEMAIARIRRAYPEANVLLVEDQVGVKELRRFR
jgi:hypothetical protein